MQDRMPPVTPCPSPNQGARRGGARPDMVVLHYTGMTDCAAALDRLADPAAEVSAHYVVDLDGRIFRMVPETARAWHAGVSAWGAVTDINSRSIGIEIVNPGHELGHPPYPAPQMQALARLLGSILARHAIAPERVVGHACIAPGRKRDPGEKFDWRGLAQMGLAVWLDPEAGSRPDRAPAPGPRPAPESNPESNPESGPEPSHEPGEGLDGTGLPDAAEFRAAARRFGYPVAPGAGWDAALLAVWQAFAMRFLPAAAAAGAGPSRAGLRHLERLAARWPVAPEPPAAASGD